MAGLCRSGSLGGRKFKTIFDAGYSLVDTIKLRGVMGDGFLNPAQPKFNVLEFLGHIVAKLAELVPKLRQVFQRQLRNFGLCSLVVVLGHGAILLLGCFRVG